MAACAGTFQETARRAGMMRDGGSWYARPVPETLDPSVTAPPGDPDIQVPSVAERSYRAGGDRACDRAYQDWAAAFDRRVRELVRGGMNPEQAGRKAAEEVGEFRRALRAILADTLLLEEAECLRAAGE